METINIIASIVVFITTVILIIKLFSDEKCILYKWKYYEREIVRIGLLFVGLGSLWNCFIHEQTPKSEVILNIGIAIVFLAVLYKEIKRK